MIRNEDCISFLLGKAYQHVHQDARQRLASFGVTPVQFALLNVLWFEDGLSGAELGARLQLDSATITGVIDRLTNQGLIERRPDAKDRRINRVFLTAEGTRLRDPLSKVIAEFNQTFFSRFSHADAEKLREMLTILGEVPVMAE